MTKSYKQTAPYLMTEEWHAFFDTFFRLLGPDGNDTELGEFVHENRKQFLNLIMNQTHTGGIYKQWCEMLDKYLPGWMEEE